MCYSTRKFWSTTSFSKDCNSELGQPTTHPTSCGIFFFFVGSDVEFEAEIFGGAALWGRILGIRASNLAPLNFAPGLHFGARPQPRQERVRSCVPSRHIQQWTLPIPQLNQCWGSLPSPSCASQRTGLAPTLVWLSATPARSHYRWPPNGCHPVEQGAVTSAVCLRYPPMQLRLVLTSSRPR